MTKVVLCFFLLVKDGYVSHSSTCLRALNPALTEEKLSLGSQWSLWPSAGLQPQTPVGAPRRWGDEAKAALQAEGTLSAWLLCWTRGYSHILRVLQGHGVGAGRGATYSPELIKGEECSFRLKKNPLPPASSCWHLWTSLVVQMVKCLPITRETQVPWVWEIPGLGRAPGEGNGNPLQYSCLENPMDMDREG